MDTSEINNIKDKVYKHRTILNSIAEVGKKEFKTSKYIQDYLDEINVEYSTYLETSVIGILKGKNKKKTIAFRSDIDGLLTEDGVKHLCGHDGHMSILLGLIEFLNQNKDKLNDDIVFIFQQAEEGPGGAKDLINEGIFKTYNIDEIYGLHIYPEIETGYVGVKDGYFMAQVGDFDINITAKSAHAAMPQNGVDGIVVASNLVNCIQTIISRNVRPIDTAVISIGYINGGTKRNIIAENVNLQGTIRTFKPELYQKIKGRLREICRGLEVTYNCKIDLEIRDDYPAVNNDTNLYNEFIKSIDSEKIIKLEPLMISEDFSYYQRQIPGLFFMLGSKDIKKGYTDGLHSLNFDFDKEVLLNGVNIYIELLKFKKSIE